jgi:hypothetical protein
MEELQVSLQEEGRTKMTRATLLARGVLVLALAAGNEAPVISDPHIAADLARIRAHPIGEEEAILSTFPVKRQIQIVLHNRMHTAETVLGESVFEKESVRCIRAAALELMSREAANSIAKVFASINMESEPRDLYLSPGSLVWSRQTLTSWATKRT